MRALIVLFALLAAPSLAFAQSKGRPPAEAPAPPPPEADLWKATLEAAVPSVVAIRVVGTRSFDTEAASSSVGTGFIVDAERGLILTNRHMVHAGPVVAEAVLYNHEEIPLQAVYRDPVHDFGFYRFDPSAVRFMEVKPLTLDPAGAKVGVNVRVVGNDAGEKISILDGTLARLDREAPVYGDNTYNDFNTFYIQAASGTSGGSSGSPVLDLSGKVVALNAGGRRNAASSYYLPLDRVVRALALIQAGQPVTRGTLQTVFLHAPYDELRRLGLSEKSETEVRAGFPDGTGLLVVSEVVPGGPADGKLRPGDVLLAVDGVPLNAFVPLEARLDERVGAEVTLTVERGGQTLTVPLSVGDLHSISPDAYLEFGGGVLNELSYHQARNHSVPVKGVYVAATGYALTEGGIPEGAILTAIDGLPVSTLEEVEAALAAHPHGARVPVRYFPIQDPRQDQVAVIQVDRLWFPMQRCVRDDLTGGWPCTPSPAPSKPLAEAAGEASFVRSGGRAQRRLSRSLVMVEYRVPYRTEGVSSTRFTGAGIIVDAERGLVVVDRDTVPVGLGELELTFGGSLRVPGEIVSIHPLHNVAVVKYDPADIGATPVKSARLRDKEIKPGDKLYQVGLTGSHQVVSQRARVGRVTPLYLPLPDPPSFREANQEIFTLSDGLSSVGGAITDRRGRVVATWASFASSEGGGRSSAFYGLPIEVAQSVVEPLQAGEEVSYRALGVELYGLPLADARDRGLPEPWLDRLQAHDETGGQVLYVGRLTAGTPAAAALKGGDLLLAVNQEVVTRFDEVEALCQAGSVTLTVFRDGMEQNFVVETTSLSGQGVTEVVSWAGMLLHAPHLEVASQRGFEPEGVYVTWFWYGSPAHRYGLRPTRRIIEVDGQPTPDLASFLAVVNNKQDRDAVRLTLVDLEDKTEVKTLKLDLAYWPTQRFVFVDGEGWRREDAPAPTPSAAP